MTHSIAIRRGSPQDAERLAEFGRRTFAEAFGSDNDPRNMAAYLGDNYGIERQAQELESREVITLLAEQQGRMAAFAQVRRSMPPESVEEGDAVELWRFYVDKPWQGRGVAQLLMRAVLEAAADLGGGRIWLSVWERNARALAFYAKCGFQDVGARDFWVGSDRQTDRVLVRDLNKAGDGDR
jgi:ribosomal protein S18 acetylase RimI-like enzyme